MLHLIHDVAARRQYLEQRRDRARNDARIIGDVIFALTTGEDPVTQANQLRALVGHYAEAAEMFDQLLEEIREPRGD